jgi:hypothetical protein
MNTLHTAEALIATYHGFCNEVNQLSEQQYVTAPAPGKWSIAQHQEHLLKSTSPVALAFSMPYFLLNWKFGKANRPSRTYEELQIRYKEKLGAGGVAPSGFLPKERGIADREKLSNKLIQVAEKTSKKLIAKTEADLEKYVLPHPLLGKLTLREIAWFTVFHGELHLESVRKIAEQLK